jgi:hypothetical protein
MDCFHHVKCEAGTNLYLCCYSCDEYLNDNCEEYCSMCYKRRIEIKKENEINEN